MKPTLRLAQDTDQQWETRGHFFAAAAEAMRRILVERARRTGAAKRGGGRQRVTLEGVGLTFDIDPAELLGLDEALVAMESEDLRMSQVVKFDGLVKPPFRVILPPLALAPRPSF